MSGGFGNEGKTDGKETQFWFGGTSELIKCQFTLIIFNGPPKTMKVILSLAFCLRAICSTVIYSRYRKHQSVYARKGNADSVVFTLTDLKGMRRGNWPLWP